MRDCKPSLTVPTLTSERPTQEPLTRAHSDGMCALWSQAEVCRYSGPAFDVDGQPIALPAVTPSGSDKIIDFFLDGAAALTKAERRFIDAVAFNAIGTCLEVASHPHPAFWVHGYVARASLAGLQCLRSEPEHEIIAAANVRSIKRATRLSRHRGWRGALWDDVGAVGCLRRAQVARGIAKIGLIFAISIHLIIA